MNISIRKIANGYVITATPPYDYTDTYNVNNHTKEYYAPDIQAVVSIVSEVMSAIEDEVLPV